LDSSTGVYSVGSMSGAITAVGNPTAETLTIRAMNGGSKVTAQVTVTMDSCLILSSNRALSSGGPVFGQSSYSITASSCSSGTVIGQGKL
jgi:hypothetical protein